MPKKLASVSFSLAPVGFSHYLLSRPVLGLKRGNLLRLVVRDQDLLRWDSELAW